MKNILIVEDDHAFGSMLRRWFERNGFAVSLCTGVESAKKELERVRFGLVMSDLRLPDGDGIMLLSWIKEQKERPPVIIMTHYGDVKTAVASMKLGAFDYLEKPVNPEILKQKVEQALAQKPDTTPKSSASSKSDDDPEIIHGKSQAAQAMLYQLLKIAPTKMTVLITGESGSGKEYVARTIHANSKRKEANFIAVDCGSLSKELAPSELFGHLKGSFTSAISDKKGVFEQAGGGTVFLDEVGNLSYDVQVQLLRALQELKIRPVGSAADIKVDVRIIAATNEDLETAIADNRFREDLYHRLNEFSVHIPPLRERGDDVVLFVEHFLSQANKELERQVQGITKEALDVLKEYHWPGNLRELRNTIRRAVLFAEGTEISANDLPPSLSEAYFADSMPLRPDNEKEQIAKAIVRAKGNKTQAARLLKIDRKTLYNKMHQYGMDI